MTLDDLITWHSSQAHRLTEDAEEMANTAANTRQTVDLLHGRAAIHRETVVYLRLHRDQMRRLDNGKRRTALFTRVDL